MSTTIDVYPSIDRLPLVEHTRARTEQLFQELLDRHNLGSRVEVKAFYPGKHAGDEVRYVPTETQWQPGLDLGFAYWINGKWDSSSWPSCCGLGDEDFIDAVHVEFGSATADEIGRRALTASDFPAACVAQVSAALEIDHYWYEYRNAGGPAVASIGYGFAAAALAEATNGIMASFDSAFDEIERNGQTAEQFLRWWGDHQIAFYGVDRFRSARG